MKAAVVTGPGVAPRYMDFPDPTAAPGREVVQMVAAAIHPVVRSKASGAHYSSGTEYPLVPGVDAVVRTADGSLAYSGGVTDPFGTFAEKVLLPTSAMVLVPEDADPVAVAAGMNPGMASWMPLTEHLARHPSLGIVVVLGATGVAGRLAVQNALSLGAESVIAVGRDVDALEQLATLGAHTVTLVGDPSQDALELTIALAGTTPALILDFLWGAPSEAMFPALLSTYAAGSSEHVQIGSIAGEHAQVPAALLRSRRFQISGSGVGSFDTGRYLTEARGYVGRIARGEVSIHTVSHSLDRVEQAWEEGADPRVVITRT